MKKIATIISLVIITSSFPLLAHAVKPAPRITDREIVERLTRVETKLDSVEESIKQLREDMNAQFNRLNSVMLGIFSGFVVLVGAIIGFALWDRRTMIRPFETKVKEIEEDIAENRTKLHSLLDALRSLSKTDKRVAEVLRSFNLL